MKTNWQTKKIGKICDFYNGLWKGKEPPYINVGVIRNTNFTKDGNLDDVDIAYLPVEIKQFSKRKLNFGDVILEKSGGGPKQPVGRVIIFDKKDGDYSFSNFTSAIRIKNSDEMDFNFLHKFLYFSYISGVTKLMQSHSTGIRNLDLNKYKEIEIFFPSLAEQKRIVKIIDEAFEKLEKAKQNAENNLQNSKELFESYLKSIFNNINTKHEEKKLSEVASLVDSLHQTPIYVAEGYPMVRVTDIKTGFLNLEKTKKVTEKTFHKFSQKHTPKIGDIVFSRVGSYGVSSIVNSGELFCLGQNTVFILPRINSYYLYYFINSMGAKKQIDKLVAGTTQPTISLKSIREIIIPVPSLLEQKSIVKKLDQLSEQTKKLESVYRSKLSDIEELKKSILNSAFEGKL